MEKENSAIYKILKALRTNVIKILIALNEKEQLEWKELKEETELPTATLNRSISALQEINFIDKKESQYELSWAGKLAIDGLFLLGLKMGEYPKEKNVEDIVAEHVLAQNIVLAILVIILASIKVRGNLNIKKLGEEIGQEKNVIYKVLEDYEKEGYLKIEDGKVKATAKLEELELDNFLSI